MMGGIGDTTGKKVMANSLLSAAASHSLMDDENLLLLQDVSLQDEPEPPPPEPTIATTAGSISEMNLLNENIGFNVFPQPYMEPSPINPINILSERDNEFSHINLFGRPDEVEKSPFDAFQDFQPKDVVKSPNKLQSDAGRQTTFASSLFQAPITQTQDSFQVSMLPPPTRTNVEASLNPYTNTNTPYTTPPPAYSQLPQTASYLTSTINAATSAIAAFNSSIRPSTHPTVPSAPPIITSAPPLMFNPSTLSTPNVTGEIQTSLTSTRSVPLFPPSTADNFQSPYFGGTTLTLTAGNTGSSPSLLFNPETSNSKEEFYTPATSYQNMPGQGAADSSPIPMFNPESRFGMQAPANSTPLPPSTYNPAIFPNSNSVGYHALPPKGTSNSPSEANHFRRVSQKPVYVAHPGIASSGVGQQQPNFGQAPQASIEELNQFRPEFFNPILTDNGGNSASTQSFNMAVNNSGSPLQSKKITYPYTPTQYHWFTKREVEGRTTWKPFSLSDSLAIEEGYINETTQLVSTDGGRYDVDLTQRLRLPVYWEEKQPAEVKRGSWFYKGPLDSRFTPYDEQFSINLEAEYYKAVTSGIWHKRIEFGGGEVVILHAPTHMVHFCQAASPDEWGNIPEAQLRPRVVKRGVAELDIEEGEPKQIDHLIFVVHGIGSICDFKFRNIIEAVDEFRSLSSKLVYSHFKEASSSQKIGRIEFLPIQWHMALHGDNGIDQKLKPITLKSIPRLRNFTNDTLLDILFYTSPVYSQTIVDTVGTEINRMHDLFNSRNPNFNGMVALGGHSLGSLILYDILTHQPKVQQVQQKHEADTSKDMLPSGTGDGHGHLVSFGTGKSKSRLSTATYTVGPAGTGTQNINYPTLKFHPTAFFAMGSPIAMFVTIRGTDQLGVDFHFPTVPSFFNIFHPYDPVAYRIEPLVDPSLDLRPVLIPHHKGRKRLHLEVKETMARLGADLKKRVLESFRATWNTVYQLTSFNRAEAEQDIDRVIEGELEQKFDSIDGNGNEGQAEPEIVIGKVNGGRRIDYVLQESPVETLNEYLFALSSHAVYWSSEDTVLLILKEVYEKLGVSMDSAIISALTDQVMKPGYPNSSQDTTVLSVPFVQKVLDISSNSNVYSSAPLPSLPNTDYPITTSINTSIPNMIQVPPTAPNLYNLNPNSTPTFLPNYRAATPSVPAVLGARPVVSPDNFPISCNIDPTAPISSNTKIGPPPLAGFVGTRRN